MDSFKVNSTTEKGYKFKIRKFQRLLTVSYVPAAITFFVLSLVLDELQFLIESHKRGSKLYDFQSGRTITEVEKPVPKIQMQGIRQSPLLAFVTPDLTGRHKIASTETRGLVVGFGVVFLLGNLVTKTTMYPYYSNFGTCTVVLNTE